jgi:LmbE family N-acetylglucosaminyl deacetylase
MKNVLVIGAHPDDELLGVGGTIIRHIKMGDKVFVYLLTDGHTSRYRDPKRVAEQSPEVVARVKSAERVAKTIGFELHFGLFYDQRLDTVPHIELVHEIERIASNINPDIVYCHHKGDVNTDHQITFSACMTAFRSVGKVYPVRFLTYETFSSTEWGIPSAESYFMPNVFINISKHLAELYSQEMREFPHPRSYKGVEINAQRWGTHVGVDAAEAFMLIREVL